FVGVPVANWSCHWRRGYSASYHLPLAGRCGGMKFGIYIGPFYPGDMDGASAFDLARRMPCTANESGFDGIFAAHHYSTGPSQMIFHPLLMLARLSAECPEAYLGTAVYLLPYTHPVIAAEAAAFLDVMSGGKFIFGVGRGYRNRTGEPPHPARRTGRTPRGGSASRPDALDGRPRIIRRKLLLVHGHLDPAEADPT